MTESEARSVLIMRAFEWPLTEPWTEREQAWASAEASRVLGESASYAQWVAQRAQLATRRIAERAPEVTRAIRASGGHGWLIWALPLAAFATGLAADAVGSAQRINILSPPLLALLLWNLTVYAMLAVASLRRWRQDGHSATTTGPLRRALGRLLQRAMYPFAKQAEPGGTRAALPRFFADWIRCGEPLHIARLATALHLAAAAVAAGMLASLYVRGLAFEYRAGWDSTFLTPQNLHDLLSMMLGWASSLSGLTLPDARQLANLRFSAGPGENAARWIHLYALSVALLVLLPRLALAAAAAVWVRRYSRHFPLRLDDGYFQQLRCAHAHVVVPVLVLPYSYRLTPEIRAGLQSVLTLGFGPGIELTVAEPVPLGGEDELDHWLPPSVGSETPALVALFALTATPEHENHGALIKALAATRAVASKLVIMIDESGFRKRFTGTEGKTRLLQRRSAWERMVHDLGQVPVFVDLAAPDLQDATTQLQQMLLPGP